MPAVAQTDHGNLFGTVEFYEKARANGVKPIIGCEVYFAGGSRFDREKKQREETGFDAINHLLLLAMDATGYQNLMQLVSKAYLEGFYYKPRIDWELLERHHEGLICTSGCLSAPVPRADPARTSPIGPGRWPRSSSASSVTATTSRSSATASRPRTS